MKKKIRLNTIIFAAVTMVAVITLLTFWFVCNRKLSQMITDRVVEDYAQTTLAVQNNIDTLISYTEDFSKYLSLDEKIQALMKEQDPTIDYHQQRSDIEIRRDWERISNRLIYSTSRLAGFGVYGKEELLYSYYNSFISYDTDIIPQGDMDQAKNQKEPLWTDLMILHSNTAGWYQKEEAVYSVLKYVQDDRGEHVGTLALFVREDSFSNVLANADDLENRQFYLVNENNRIVSAVDNENLCANAGAVLGLTPAEYQACVEKGQLLLEPAGAAPILYMTSPIQGTPFRLVGRTVLEELQVQRRELAMFMQIALILGLMAAVAASWFVSMQVTRPINQIIGVMKKIEDSPNKEKLRCPVSDIEETNQLGIEFNRLMDKVDEAADQIYQEQRQRRHNEVRLLQAQIVPHFLYNTLGMISAFVKLNRREDALDAIRNLATFYRMSLSGGNERITVKEEMELTRNYLELQKMRHIEYVDYTMVHDENTDKFIVPKLLIQPLVENVLNHGLKANGEKCLIIIETRYDPEDNCCMVAVCDTGRGIAPERLTQIRESLRNESSLTKSFGILNVYQRMKLVYGDRFSMHVDSDEGKFTQFLLKFQVAEKEGETHV